ncbi:MAG: ABC transporter ATP-binding protein [Chitinivibrionales bacterium]|nr:ABC transporter ATP-binding protein [Chitinivibrionales bacterium]
MSDTHVVELKDIRKEYMLGQTKVEALRGVCLVVEKREFIAVAGPSGSGKSTILNMIGCIDTPTAGEIIINDKPVKGLSERELTRYRRVTISFIFQSFNLIPVLNVYENIELPLLLQKLNDPQERKARVMHFIESVGLTDRMKNKPSELSGGQRQRVAIARALVTKPVMILADEPTANLDSATGGRILDLMREINTKEGTTFIFSTHDQHIIDHARRIVRIFDGLIVGDEVKGA